MKKFESISEHRILNLAYYELLNRLDMEETRNNACLISEGREDVIAKARIPLLKKQIKEIGDRILEIENENKK